MDLLFHPAWFPLGAMEPLALTGNYRIAGAILFGLVLGFVLVRTNLNCRTACLDALTFRDSRLLKTLLLALGIGVLMFYGARHISAVQQHIKPGFFWAEVAGGIISGIGFSLVALTPLTAVAALASGRFYALIVLIGMFLAIPCVHFAERQLSEIITQYSSGIAANLEPAGSFFSMQSPPLWIAGICIFFTLLLHFLLPSKE